MKNLEIKTYPDPCLRIKTRTVDEFGPELKVTMASMAEMMYVSQGIGLAATQVGLGLSVMVVDIGEGIINFINPTIVESSDKKTVMEEGCLSLPGMNVNVKRPEKIKVRAQDINGEFFIKSFDGLYAKAIQHEVDHLCGRLILDYLDPVRKFFAARKLKAKNKSKKVKTCEVMCHVGTKDK